MPKKINAGTIIIVAEAAAEAVVGLTLAQKRKQP